MSKSNMQRLGQIFEARMQRTAGASARTTIELGKVNSDMSITTDGLLANIPRGDYMVNLALTGGMLTSTESHTHSGGDHSHSGGDHNHSLPSSHRGLRSGDRILVAWCGHEPVVIAIVVSS